MSNTISSWFIPFWYSPASGENTTLEMINKKREELKAKNEEPSFPKTLTPAKAIAGGVGILGILGAIFGFAKDKSSGKVLGIGVTVLGVIGWFVDKVFVKGKSSTEKTEKSKDGSNATSAQSLADFINSQRKRSETIAEGLSKPRNEMTQDELIQAVTNKKIPPDTKELLCVSIGNIGNQDVIETLIGLFDDNEIDKITIFKTFFNLASRKIDIKKAVPKLIEHFKEDNDFDFTEKVIAAEVLICSKDDKAVDLVIDSAKDATNGDTKQACIRALGKQNVKSALPTIREIFNGNPAPKIKAEAATALTEIAGIKEVEDELINMFIGTSGKDDDESYYPYRLVKKCLGNLGDNETIGKLNSKKEGQKQAVLNEIDALIETIKTRLTSQS